jgi:hypothetical protein
VGADHAEYRALENVATFPDFNGDTVGEELGGFILGRDADLRDRSELWERLGAFSNPEGAYHVLPPPAGWCWGFIDGATEVWEEVADKV